MINQMDQKIGEFTVGTQVMVSDPCYEDGDQTINTLPGTWVSYVTYNDEGRVAVLMAHNKEYFNIHHMDESDFRFITDELGVDSGQMAICDLIHYKHTDEEYHKYCNATLSDFYAGIIDKYACASSSGWGDGEYTLYGIYSDRQKDEYCALLIEFINEDEEDDSDNEYYDDSEDDER